MDSTQHFDESMSTGEDQSPLQFNKINKMHKMKDARREWEQRHCSNSPFRAAAYHSSSSAGYDSVEYSSPISTSKGYTIRASGVKGEQCTTPINLSNKQSSFFKKKNSSGIQQKNPPLNTISSVRAAQASTLSSGSAESLSPNNLDYDEGEIHEGFGGSNERDDQETVFLEGECYLKTKTDRFKDHWAVLNGNEIFCYRS